MSAVPNTTTVPSAAAAPSTTTVPSTVAAPSAAAAPVHEEVHAEVHESSSRTICIAIDGSSSSTYAIEWAIKNILRKETDQVVVLHVRPLITIPALSYGAPFVDYGETLSVKEDASRIESHELLIKTAKAIKQHGLHVRAIALRGDAREELVFKIEDVKADMVIMGSRGLTTLNRLFLGSVSEHLIHNLKCPVIVTRDPNA
ncbi:hypothetical protein QVD99_004174 [Batrachochytrium dendrobatidis]|nr:hypothetical protein QVD99_004174 [Batrachochytrium dendrobatidis]